MTRRKDRAYFPYLRKYFLFLFNSRCEHIAWDLRRGHLSVQGAMFINFGRESFLFELSRMVKLEYYTKQSFSVWVMIVSPPHRDLSLMEYIVKSLDKWGVFSSLHTAADILGKIKLCCFYPKWKNLIFPKGSLGEGMFMSSV